MTRRILVAGAGYIGSVVAQKLADRGDDVFALARRVPTIAGVKGIAADLMVCDQLRTALPEGLEGVVYSAAADQSDEASYRAIYVDGLRHLIEALGTTQSSAAKLVFCSSTGVYAEDQGGWVDESSARAQLGFRGTTMARAEDLLGASTAHGLVARLGGIYGPGRIRLLTMVKKGMRGGSDAVWTNRIHRDDAARALIHILDHGTPGEAYNVVDDKPTTLGEIVDGLADLVGLPHPQTVSSHSSERRGLGKRIRSDRLRALGFEPEYPDYLSGYAALVDGV